MLTLFVHFHDRQLQQDSKICALFIACLNDLQ